MNGSYADAVPRGKANTATSVQPTPMTDAVTSKQKGNIS